jgi:hypothetical protein
MLLVDGEVVVVGELELWYQYSMIGDEVASVMLLGVARQQAMSEYLWVWLDAERSHVTCATLSKQAIGLHFRRGSFLLVKANFALRTCKRVPVLTTW